MSKLIVEMEINGIPDCCGLCDPLFAVVCATKHDQTIDKMMLRAGRPSWCPIVGVLPDEHGDLIDKETAKNAFDSSFLTFRMKDGETMRGFYKRTIDELPVLIAAERKDDGTTAD